MFLVQSLSFVVSTLVNHYSWFSYFSMNHHPMKHIVSMYLIMIWGIPLALMVSMSNSTQGLPNFGKPSNFAMVH